MGTADWEKQLKQIERQEVPVDLFQRITARIQAALDGRFTPLQTRWLFFLAILVLVLNLIVLLSFYGSGTSLVDTSQIGIREYHQLYQVP